MREETATFEDQTFGLVDVVSVEVVQHLQLRVTFEDNTTGLVVISPSWLTGVFEELKDEQAFRNVSVVHGAVTWDNELDLAPDTMYEAIKQHGEYYLG
ncbi:DUF2442 domain-containing protein [Vibrio parahaemolyticus]|nr:DUF2442 domain-containing protein [Vibrio parahaemolyticus]HCM0701250.1 DUF2442 domain-containing protein [Vibrio parahaemolyticus]